MTARNKHPGNVWPEQAREKERSYIPPPEHQGCWPVHLSILSVQWIVS